MLSDRGFSASFIAVLLIASSLSYADGPTGHQPSGPLTGVTVYCTAGHGWVVGDTGWGLQRPLLHGMIEDYGNIDQLNYFVEHLYRSGATVVPMRPVGHQLNEVVLDQDDPGVTFTGSWAPPIVQKYFENNVTLSGIPCRVIETAATETATARYTPDLPASGVYPVYTWAPHGSSRAVQTYRIVHAGSTTELQVDHRRVGNGWVWLGNYYFEAGTSGYVEITNESETAGGFVVADAIRFGNGMGDIIGDGAETVSGYPREEEGALYWAWRGAGLDAVGLPTRIWHYYTIDLYNDWSAGRFWAAEMNNEYASLERWEKVYLSFHSNAATGSARGTIALYNDTDPTQYQEMYAQIMGNEVEEDLQLQDGLFEHTWATRNDTFGGGYDNKYFVNDEFDTTTLEVAFHDNEEDAELLRDPRVRDAVARASVHGIIKFLNALPDSQVPLRYAPVQPTNLAMFTDPATGEVTLSWTAPVSGEAYGDPATGYRLYRSSDGLAFDAGEDIGNGTSILLAEMGENETIYYKVAAYNDGGESRSTEVISALWLDNAEQTVLVVNSFDSFSRLGNTKQVLSATRTIERQIEILQNPRNSIIQYADALQACGVAFDTVSRDYLESHREIIPEYDAIIWMTGNQASPGHPVDSVDITSFTTCLNSGGSILLSGSNIVEELDYYGERKIFCRGVLRAAIVETDAGTNGLIATPETIFGGLPDMTFAVGDVPYNVSSADVISVLGATSSLLQYDRDAGGSAALASTYGDARFILMSIPFETINTQQARQAVMQRVMRYLTQWGIPFDADEDGDIDLDDYADFESCFTGLGTEATERCKLYHDPDQDGDIDLADFAKFQAWIEQ